MVICAYCGAQADPGNRFCKVCGQPLAPGAVPPAVGAPPSTPLYGAPPSVPLYPTYPTYPTAPPPVPPNPYAPSTTPLAGYPATGYPATGYPGSPYAQPSVPLAPYAQPYAPVAQRPATRGGLSTVPRQTWIIGGVVLAVIVVAAFFFIRNSSLTGEWYGPITFPGQSSPVTTGEMYLSLQQGSDGSITGSGSTCGTQGGQDSNFDVSGTISGSNVSLDIAAYTFTGTFSGGTLQLSDNAILASATIILNRGSQDAFNAACQSLTSQ